MWIHQQRQQQLPIIIIPTITITPNETSNFVFVVFILFVFCWFCCSSFWRSEAADCCWSSWELSDGVIDCSSGIDGGDLGYLPHTRLTPEYYENIKGKKKGTIVGPFRTQYGIHVVKLLGEKTGEQINTDMYKKIIYDNKRDEILNKYFASIKKKAKIKVFKENIK